MSRTGLRGKAVFITGALAAALLLSVCSATTAEAGSRGCALFPAAKKPVAKRTKSRQPRASALNLSITYLARVAVPAGSDIKIDVSSSGGRAIASSTFKTRSETPPYAVAIDLPSRPQMPLKINVVLSSSFGHKLSGSATVSSATLKAGRPIPVTLDIVN